MSRPFALSEGPMLLQPDQRTLEGIWGASWGSGIGGSKEVE